MTDLTPQGDCPVCGEFYFHNVGCMTCEQKLVKQLGERRGRKPSASESHADRREAKRIANEARVEKRHEASRQLWAELHSKQDPTPEWFAGWLARIPRFGCACRKDFEAIIEANPPRYDDLFAWSVEAHNAVNAKLNKPIMSLEDAVKVWRTAPQSAPPDKS